MYHKKFSETILKMKNMVQGNKETEYDKYLFVGHVDLNLKVKHCRHIEIIYCIKLSTEWSFRIYQLFLFNYHV